MPLQSSGAISLSDMQSFFGLGYSFASYRGRGSVPASGPISFSQMFGATLRDPTSGDYYSSPTSGYRWRYERDEFGGAYSGGGIYWNGSAVGNYSAAAGSSYTTGGWTYYRSSQRTSGSYKPNRNTTVTWYAYGIYRIK